MADIFISYSRKDSNIVGAFVWRLEHEGFKVWIDRDGIYSGNVFAEVIATAIEESKVLIFFSSENSNISPWTAGEIGIANMYGKHIIPVRLDHSPYNKRVIIHLVNLDYIDYSDPSKHYVMMEKLVKELRELCPDTAPRE
ncbi:MAG: toll/interleukin-1 receptor domain-containing protein, partial [Bacteroidales bacterium]|nr:toll/interleukin-1 receptor domain-containing protein [Bacteroidales bacterium]